MQVEAREEDFKDEVDPITLTHAFEIQHPIAFKDGSGGLKPPIYDMMALRQWVLEQKPTFPHTGLYSDLSQVAAVRWRTQNTCQNADESENVCMLADTQAKLLQLNAEPKTNFMFIFYQPNSLVFR